MQPLAERLRPQTLDEYVGQAHLVGQGAPLRRAVDSDRLPSLILWGPPGVGKTSLAHLLTRSLQRPFFELSAVSAGVKDVREAIDRAGKQRLFDAPSPVLFIDEIHRFSKSQQDALLGAVERGVVTLIGATTENPSFEVNAALLSRCQVYVLESLSAEQLRGLVDAAVERDVYLKQRNVKVLEYEALLRSSGGDARRLYNTLELVASSPKAREPGINNELVLEIVQSNASRYDKSGEQHYDLASALIKSIRGSDVDAALYYLARMIAGGEDINFISRRLVISASEDIGLANPNALLMATTCAEAARMVGHPEARIVLAQATVYLATSPKSNSSYAAINEALAEVKRSGDLPVPLHLRNASTTLMRELGYGKDYAYAHDGPGNFVGQPQLPPELANKRFFQPGDNPTEVAIADRLRRWWPQRYPSE